MDGRAYVRTYYVLSTPCVGVGGIEITTIHSASYHHIRINNRTKSTYTVNSSDIGQQLY